MMVEDAPGSRRPVKDRSPHFPIFEEFKNASYLQRYDVLCQRLVQEQLYTNATILTSEKSAVTDGKYSELSNMTGLKSFITSLAGHIATAAARLN
jgi:type II restriction enzyme